MNANHDPSPMRGLFQGLRRLLIVGAVAAAAFQAWSQVDPEATLRLRVAAALTTADVWAVGTDLHVDDRDVRVQGFVRSEEDRRRVLHVVAATSGVRSVEDALAITAWPQARITTVGTSEIALAGASAN